MKNESRGQVDQPGGRGRRWGRAGIWRGQGEGRDLERAGIWRGRGVHGPHRRAIAYRPFGGDALSRYLRPSLRFRRRLVRTLFFALYSSPLVLKTSSFAPYASPFALKTSTWTLKTSSFMLNTPTRPYRSPPPPPPCPLHRAQGLLLALFTALKASSLPSTSSPQSPPTTSP